MWDAISTLFIAMLFIVAIFGWPMYYVITHWLTPAPKPMKYPFRKPCVFTNTYGHLVRVDPNPEELQRVQEYYRYRPQEARELLDSLKKNYEEKW
jgi:hypothetical protein